VGPGNYVAAYPRYARGGEMMTRNYVTHNAYAAVLAETGIPGLLLFLAIGASVLAESQRTIRVAREAGHPDVEMLAVAVEISVIAVLVASLSGNTEGLKLLWMNAGMAMGLCRLRDAPGPVHYVAQVLNVNRVNDKTAAAHAGPILSGKG
jgi:O-antigen ligase